MSLMYYVTIPIAGHACLRVEAESEKDAIDKAMEAITIDNIEEWVGLDQFNQGNTCYCPKPWKAQAELDSDQD